jgi:hypothetical protein
LHLRKHQTPTSEGFQELPWSIISQTNYHLFLTAQVDRNGYGDSINPSAEAGAAQRQHRATFTKAASMSE